MLPEHDQLLWQRLTAQLRRMVPATTFEIWLAPLRWGGIDNETIVVLVPPESHSWIEDRFLSVLAVAAQHALATPEPPAIALRSTTHRDDAAPSQRRSAPPPDPAPPPASRQPQLHPKYTFEQFVIGASNRFAHAAALAAAELPGSTFNPIFLVGPPGTGKTHLLHSIGNYITAYGSGLSVRYTTAEDFANHFRTALDRRQIDPFKTAYRGTDVLLLDDVQFLARKARTEEEFFHTFNTLREAGSQIVLTSDRHPRDMSGLEQRLCQRFESGLLIELAPPDASLRRALVRKRALLDDIDLSAESVTLIADRVTDNVRSIEAALIRIAAYASLTGDAIDLPLVTRVLDQLYGRGGLQRSREAISVDRIQRLVAQAYGLTIDELLSSSRTARIAWPRQLAMYFAREHTNQSLPAIGAAFGGRDHTTVLHACRRAGERLAGDQDDAQRAEGIVRELLGSSSESDRSS